MSLEAEKESSVLCRGCPEAFCHLWSLYAARAISKELVSAKNDDVLRRLLQAVLYRPTCYGDLFGPNPCRFHIALPAAIFDLVRLASRTYDGLLLRPILKSVLPTENRCGIAANPRVPVEASTQQVLQSCALRLSIERPVQAGHRHEQKTASETLPQSPAVVPCDDRVSRAIKVREFAAEKALVRTTVQHVFATSPAVGLGHTLVAGLN